MGRFAVPANKRVQRFRRKIGNIVYSSGGTPGIPGGVPKAGYTTAFDLRSNQQVVTGAGAPVVANYGAYGPLALIAVVVGAQQVFAMPGWHANQWGLVYDWNYTDALAASPIATSSTNNWVNDMRIPLTVDPDSEVGAFYTGDQEVQMDLQITGAAAGTVLSTVNAATLQGSWDVWVERFNAPAPDLPGGWLNQISFYHEARLYGTFALKNGDTIIPLPIGGDYERIGLAFYTGSNKDSTFAPATGLFTQISLVVNDTLYLYERMDEATLRMEMLRNYTRNLANGFYALDFISQKENSRRDIIPTDPDVVHSLYLIIASGSASNNVDVIVERALDSPFAQKWINSARRNQQAA
jgi:hypothetical protein